MVKRTRHRSMVRRFLTGALGTLGVLAVTTQAASADSVLVKTGDTVWKIAQENKTTVKAMEDANPESIKKISNSVDLIYAGQRLNLPGTTDETMASADENGLYTVVPGDTLNKIAQHFGLSVTTLKNLNGLTGDQLYIGQRLLVAGSMAPAATVNQSTAPVQQAATTVTSSVTTNNQEPSLNQENEPITTITLKAAATNNATNDTAAVTNSENGSNVSSDTATPASTSLAGTSSAVATTTMTTGPVSSSAAVQSSSSTSVTTTNEVSANTQMANAATVNSVSDGTQSAVIVPTSSTSASTNPQTATSAQPTVNSSASIQAQSVAPQQAVQVASSAMVTSSANSATTAVTTTNSVASAASSAQPQSFTTSKVQSQSTTGVTSTAVQQPVKQSQQSLAPSQAQQATSQAQSSATAAASTATQPQSTANNDLNSGSVVSLATKIASSNSVPYVWGGASLSGMDCSGLVDYVYAHADGKQLPHNTVALESCVNQHAVNQAQAGDILFWGQHGATYHSAIYIGNNQFVAAAKPGTNVATYTISKYFMPSFAGTVK